VRTQSIERCRPRRPPHQCDTIFFPFLPPFILSSRTSETWSKSPEPARHPHRSVSLFYRGRNRENIHAQLLVSFFLFFPFPRVRPGKRCECPARERCRNRPKAPSAPSDNKRRAPCPETRWPASCHIIDPLFSLLPLVPRKNKSTRCKRE